MLAQRRLLLGSLTSLRRHLSTSATLGFKFKLTEELSAEYEEQEKKKAEEAKAPVLARTTVENKLIMGRVSSERFNNLIRVGVPKHRLNEFLLMYIRENDNVYALDENNQCNPGDWVLLEKKEFADKKVTHQVKKVVYQYGNYIDPLTGRRSFGIYYDDDIERLEKIKIDF